jgi:hypothetical protein
MDDLPLFRAIGERRAQACALRARDVAMFDSGAARAVILDALRAADGPVSGEDLVDRCLAAGIETHDGRAFGVVFSSLNRAGLIRCAGYGIRRKGHGTGGARLWEAAR